VSGLIDPTEFLVRSVDLTTEGITDSADNARAMGRSVDDRTRSISATWTGLSAGAVYQAPEQGQVYALMDPAVTTAAALRSAFDSMAGHLDTYAAALDAVRPRLVDLERRAADFRADVKDGVQVDASSAKGASFLQTLGGLIDPFGYDEEQVTVPWDEDGRSIARNKELLDEYGQLFEEITQATADCANAIGGLVTNACVATVEAVPAEAVTNPAQPMPWGSPVEEDRAWHESVGHGFATFGTDLWDGTRTMVAGYDPGTGTYGNWGLTGQAWGGLGDLIGSTLLYASPAGLVAAGMSLTGHTDNAFHRFMVDRAETAAGGWGSLIGYDAAAEDPWHAWKEDGVAAGTTAFLNIGTLFIPGAGVAGGAVKLGATGARIARIAAAGADFAVTGGSWAVRGGVRVFTGMRTAFHLGGDVLPAPADAAAGAAGAAAGTSVRLNPTALINALDDSPHAAAAHSAGSTHVSDSVFGGGDHTVATDPVGGTSADGGTPGGRDTPSGSDGTGAAPGRPDSPPPDQGAGRVDGDAGEPGRVAIDVTGNPHVVNTSDTLVADIDRPYGKALGKVLSGRHMTQSQFDTLVTTPIERLSRSDVTQLLEIRDALPAPGPDSVLQKIIPPGSAMDILESDAAVERYMEPDMVSRITEDRIAQGRTAGPAMTEVGGFVGVAADVAGQSPSQLYRSFGLDYPKNPFRPDSESMFAVRFRAGDAVQIVDGAATRLDPVTPSGPLQAMADMPDWIYDLPDDAGRRVAIQAWIDENAPASSVPARDALDPANPFRGNGFGGTGSTYAPELAYEYPKTVRVPDGAEMWRIRPDGSGELAAVFRDRGWNVIVEQPLAST
jgi:hypothetical protein